MRSSRKLNTKPEPGGRANPPEFFTSGATLRSLRAATRSAHRRIEESRPMVRLMRADYTEAEYAQHLRRLFGFYEPFEAALAAATQASSWPPSPSRTEMLRRDLEDLGCPPSEIRGLPRCQCAPLHSDSALAGSLYVYEGAALGGQVVGRYLRRSLGTRYAFAFYHSDAVGRRRQWTAFCATLERCGLTSPDAAVESALAAFAALGAWMEEPAAPAAAVR
jgi:heme oxygenase